MKQRKRGSFFFSPRGRGLLNRLTLGGKVVVCALLFALHGAISLESPLIQLFATLLGLLVVGIGIGALYRPRLQVQTGAPPSVTCNEPLQMTAALRHTVRRAHDLLIEFDDRPKSWQADSRPARVGTLRPGEQVVVPMTTIPTRRGVFPLPAIRVTSTFPLNLYRFRHRFPSAGEVVVTPAFHPLARFEIVQRLGGAHAEQLTGTRSGGSEDYLGNREYQPGVPVRRWDYCSWARLGRPVVREYQNEGQVTATLVIDTTCEAPVQAGREDPEFEAMLSLAASISDSLAREACRVNALVIGSNAISPPGISLLDQHDEILESLATASPTNDDPHEDLTDSLASIAAQPSLVFVLMNGWSASGQQLCRLFETSGSHVCRLVVGGDKQKVPPGVRQIEVSTISAGEVEIP